MTSRPHELPRDKPPPRDRRKNFRVHCPAKVLISLNTPGDGEPTRFEAKVLNLSLGGMRVELDALKTPVRRLDRRSCSVFFLTGGTKRVFPGRFIGLYDCADSRDGKAGRKTLEAGIRFEGLSIDDQFALVDLFGKIHTPLNE